MIWQIKNSVKEFIDESPAFSGPKLEACLPCFQRSKDVAGFCILHLAQRTGQYLHSYCYIYDNIWPARQIIIFRVQSRTWTLEGWDKRSFCQTSILDIAYCYILSSIWYILIYVSEMFLSLVWYVCELNSNQRFSLWCLCVQ